MPLNQSLLVRIAGFPATLIHGDTAVLDRWLWLRSRLPRTANGEKLIDVGRAALAARGMTLSERNQRSVPARLCAPATFEVHDVRQLDNRRDLIGRYDVAICCETIEHIIDDHKLIVDIAGCLRPGGRLLLTTPYFHYRPITSGDKGPFEPVENGGHVRRGYSKAALAELCGLANLVVEEISFCTGFVSQKCVYVQRTASRLHSLVARPPGAAITDRPARVIATHY